MSMSPNRTTKWIVYKSGTSEVLSAVEAGSVARLFLRVHDSRISISISHKLFYLARASFVIKNESEARLESEVLMSM